MLLTAALLLTGCDLLEDAREELTDLTNPLVGQVMLVGIAEPEDATVAAACTYAISGCMAPQASNFDSLATLDDASCVVPSRRFLKP